MLIVIMLKLIKTLLLIPSPDWNITLPIRREILPIRESVLSTGTAKKNIKSNNFIFLTLSKTKSLLPTINWLDLPVVPRCCCITGVNYLFSKLLHLNFIIKFKNNSEF